MTSKERMHIAMRRGTPDRVPIMCQLSLGHYFLYSGIPPLDVWYTSEGFAEALVRLQRRYQFDGILINMPGRPPDWRRFVHRIEEKPDAKETRVWWKNGNYSVVPWDDNVHYFLASGKRYFPTFAEIDPEKLWYVDPWCMTDITYPYSWDFAEPAAPGGDFFPEYHGETMKAVKRRVGDSVSVHLEIFSPFAQFLELLNYEYALMALLDDPRKCHAILERLTEGAIDLAGRHIQHGADAILISSAFAGGGLISRENYEEFVLPYERRVIHEAQKAASEVPFYTHTCGAIGDRLDLMMATGTNGLDTLDPPPLGTVTLEEAVAQTKGKIFIKGNIDPVNTLLRGDEKVIEEAVAHRMRVAAPGGGYIISSACSVAPATRPELMEYFSQVAREQGRYS